MKTNTLSNNLSFNGAYRINPEKPKRKAFPDNTETIALYNSINQKNSNNNIKLTRLGEIANNNLNLEQPKWILTNDRTGNDASSHSILANEFKQAIESAVNKSNEELEQMILKKSGEPRKILNPTGEHYRQNLLNAAQREIKKFYYSKEIQFFEMLLKKCIIFEQKDVGNLSKLILFRLNEISKI